MVKPRKDLVGEVFSQLTVIEQAEDYVSTDGKHHAQWLCRCSCGKMCVASASNLRTGNTKSCGHIVKDHSVRHGGRHTRLYSIWTNMKDRCYNPNTDTYNSYGRRGITVCEEWKNDFGVFRDWALENGYDDSLTIDRIDNDGNYCPENCRWVDAKTQANNRRSSVYVTVDGITRSLAAWADELGKSRSIFHARAKLYHTSVEEQVEYLARMAKQSS